MRRWLRAGFAIVVLLAGCASPERLPVGVGAAPATFPAQVYRQAARQGHAVLQVDPGSSIVEIEVFRGGSLARLGHDHAVASHDVHGYVWPDAGRADLYVALDLLVVDEPSLRAEAGFDTHPSPDDIEGTRRNMLTRVLETGRYPFALIAVRRDPRQADDGAASVSITLHGTTRTFDVPLKLEVTDAELTVSGTRSLRQSDFGIVPLSILGGAVQVKNDVTLRFRITARRVD